MTNDERFTITYHSTTPIGEEIYNLQDMSREEYNDGRGIIYASKEWCEKIKKEYIANELRKNHEQLSLDLGDNQ